MRHGEVWWANFPEPMGRRPVVLVSRQRAIEVRTYVIIASVTTRARQLPVEIPLGPEDGLPKPCVVNCDVLNTIPKQVLKERIGLLSPVKLSVLHAALRFALGLV